MTTSKSIENPQVETAMTCIYIILWCALNVLHPNRDLHFLTFPIFKAGALSREEASSICSRSCCICASEIQGASSASTPLKRATKGLLRKTNAHVLALKVHTFHHFSKTRRVGEESQCIQFGFTTCSVRKVRQWNVNYFDPTQVSIGTSTCQWSKWLKLPGVNMQHHATLH